MATHYRQAGSSSNLITVKLRSATTGQLLTGKLYSAMTINAQRTGVAGAISYTPVNGTLGTYAASSWIETAVPGNYQFSAKDADFVSGASSVDYTFNCAGAIDATEHVVLTGQNLSLPTVDASNNVHGLAQRTCTDASVIGTGTGTSTLTQTQVSGYAGPILTDNTTGAVNIVKSTIARLLRLRGH